jgi:hypothetical protein
LVEKNTLYKCSVVERYIILFSAVASGIFAARNVDKTKNGDVGRSAVALGQTAGLMQEIAKYDGAVAKTAKCALSVFSDMAKEHKAFEYAGKATKFAINNVNPLICVSGAIKTVRSDDKVKTGITEAAALTTMFAAESAVKHNYEQVAKSKACKDTLDKASKSKLLKPTFEFLEKHNLTGKVGTVVKGLAFVGASMSAYSAGQALGEDVSDKVKSNLQPSKKINRMT